MDSSDRVSSDSDTSIKRNGSNESLGRAKYRVKSHSSAPTLNLPGAKKFVDVEHERENVADDPDAFRGFRKTIRNWLLPRVKKGIHRIVDIQTTRSPRQTEFFEHISNVGTHNFQIAFFPFFWFCNGDHYTGRQLLLFITLGIYCGNWLKDYFCLPRPSQPALRLSRYGSKEFGFPSTHAISSSNLSFSILVLLCGPFTFAFWVGLPIALCYIAVVCYSRVYLGMHCLTDIIGGLSVSAVLVTFWYGLGVNNIVDDFLLDSHFIISFLVPIIFGILILYFHPEPVVYCPCFEDTTSAVGAAVGVASTAYASYQPWNNNGALVMLARYVLGVAVLVLTRFFMKPAMYKIIPWFYENFDFQGRRFLPHLGQNDHVHLKMKVVPSLSNLHEKEKDKKPPHDVDIPTKYIVYGSMCMTVSISCILLSQIPHLN